MGRPGSAVNPLLSDVVRGYYIKYNNLGYLLVQGFAGSPMQNARNCNVYIDLNSIINDVLRQPVRTEHHYEFAIAALNMVAHYRIFLHKHPYYMNPMFYFVYSDLSNERNHCHDTLKQKLHSDPNIRDIIKESVKLLILLCRYLPNVKFIGGTVSPHLIMYNNIKRFEAEQIPNIIISKDVFTFQLPVYTASLVLRPKKRHGDTSYFVNCVNSLAYSLQRGSQIAESTVNKIAAIPPQLWGLAMSLRGYPEGVDGYSLTDVIKTINGAIQSNKIGTVFNSALINSIDYRTPDGPNIVANNIKCDVNEEWPTYRNSAEANDLTWNVCLKDHNHNDLRTINDKVFGSNNGANFVDFMGILN